MKPETLKPTNLLNRRQFLQLAWKSLLGLSGALGLGGLVRYFSYQPYPTPPTRFDLGVFEEMDFSQAMVVEEAQAILIPSGSNLKAFSLVCPHLGCIVELKKGKPPEVDHFVCPCHGSQFTVQGELEQGPAVQPLRQLNLEIDENGHLILDSA